VALLYYGYRSTKEILKIQSDLKPTTTLSDYRITLYVFI
jgi:hypothetical protein